MALAAPLWRDPGIIGRNLELNRQPYTVIGVMPKLSLFRCVDPRQRASGALGAHGFTATELEGWARTT